MITDFTTLMFLIYSTNYLIYAHETTTYKQAQEFCDSDTSRFQKQLSSHAEQTAAGKKKLQKKRPRVQIYKFRIAAAVAVVVVLQYYHILVIKLAGQ